LPDPDQLAAIGVTEYFNRPDTVTIIEWGEKIKSLLPKKYLTIKIEILKNNLRKITVK
jgi:tRNA A37 threonylcarbamoyladenosine biosynthesis protein TsaE